ncbi:6-phosphogluconolactonase [Anditalea andensis]|uniref:6-phosphogluconolactonase n=1 Tax=Anditalea andensis TaxID=1048983 RepID=A0A074LJE6_9BACT|nr:6-phosphogluconolactonase [Anditalea andensis]KEO73927.1 6-phosphogluconolactonase [Anditalea andensis]
MLEKFKHIKELNEHTADLITEVANRSISENGCFTIALTGGSSPEGLYKLLASEQYRKKIDWTKAFVFWGDERWVPLDSPQSNAGAAHKDLLQLLPVPKDRIFPMYHEGATPEEYAMTYASVLEEHLSGSKHFDLILLGMGKDGHTASLFPGEAVLEEKNKKVAAYYLKSQDMYRITLTAPLINDGKNIIFLVFGEEKADALYQVLEGTESYRQFPSKLITPVSGNLYWMVDEMAAARLKKH